jgi:2-phospho-L-lactate guanylyltransferase
MALDTVAAIAACPLPVSVHVVSDDPELIAAVRSLPCQTRTHRDLPAGLNQALTVAAARLKGQPSLGTVVVLGDLPALRGEDLAAVLDRAGALGRTVVADRGGAGSTVLTAPPGSSLDPAFGPGSFHRHVVGGAIPIPAGDAVRCDVDDLTDLLAAARIGLGPRTAQVAGPAIRRGLTVLAGRARDCRWSTGRDRNAPG